MTFIVALALLQQVRASFGGPTAFGLGNNHKWHRICIHPSPHGAGYLAVAFRKAFPKSEWEFKAVSLPEVGQAAVYARWLGEKGGQL